MSADLRPEPEVLLRELHWVRRLARRLLADEALVDDVVQDAWLAARQNPPSAVGRDGSMRAWLATVVRHRVRRLVRSDRRRVQREQSVVARRENEDPAAAVARAALHSEVTQAVRGLDEPFRSALLWHYLDELPATEVARRQGIRHAAARQRISRGLQLLRDRLDHLHRGGFVAWCVDWSRVLGPALPATAGTVPLLTLNLMLMNKWLLLSVAAVAALWFGWPQASVAPLAPGERGGSPPSVERADVGRGAGTEAAQRADATTAQLALLVVDEGERALPLPQLQVLALRGGELVAQTATDEAGRALFAASLPADEWVFAQAGAVPTRRPRAAMLEQGIERVVIATGHAVAGELRGDVSAVTSLQLEHDRGSSVWQGLGERATAALAVLGLSARAIELPVDANQRFCCRGLAADWSGALHAPDGFAIREPSRRGAVEADALLLLMQPADGIVLELTAPLVVRGRVLASGAPVSGLHVAVIGVADPVDMPSAKSDTDVAGRFSIGLRRPGRQLPLLGQLLVMQAGAGELLRLPLRTNSDRRELDVGDLLLGASLQVRVLGAGDAAVAGASVRVRSGNATAAVRSDESGWARFAAVPLLANTVWVTADGYRAQHCELPTDGALTVRLVPTNELVVRAMAVDGSKPAAALALRIAADQPFLSEARSEVLRGEDGRYGLLLTLGDDGEARLSDLEPGVLLQLAVLDDLGQLVAEHTVASPGPARRTLVELVTTAQVFVFAGLVRGEQGRPVPRARVHLEADGFAVHGRTDASGRFALGPLRRALSNVHLEILHPAFVGWVRDDVAVDPGAAPLEVSLERGRSLEVSVLQQSGAPLPSGIVIANLEGGDGGIAECIEVGRYEFDGIARRLGRVYVALGGHEFAVPIGAHESFVELRVPDLGGITVRLDEAIEQRGVMLCVAITAVGRDQVDRRYFRQGEPPVLSSWLPAGSYRLQLEQRRTDRRGFELLGEARPVVITAGSNFEVVLP